MEIGCPQLFPDGCRTWHGGVGSRKALKFFSTQCCCDEPPALHLILQLRIPVVFYQLVPLSPGEISLHTQHQAQDNSSLLLHPPVASLPGCPGHSFPRAQHHSRLCVPAIAVCHPGMCYPGD